MNTDPKFALRMANFVTVFIGKLKNAFGEKILSARKLSQGNKTPCSANNPFNR
jgi:hypothetical protein